MSETSSRNRDDRSSQDDGTPRMESNCGAKEGSLPRAIKIVLAIIVSLCWMRMIGHPKSATAQLKVVAQLTNYDTTLCGTTKCKTVALKNTGATALTINSIAALTPPFANDPATPFLFPLTIAAGDSLVFDFCYSPTSSGTADTSFSLVYYGVNSMDSIRLIGKSVSPKLSVSPTSLDFGVEQLFNTNCLNITITNTGTGTLVTGVISGVNPPFTIQTPPPATIPAGGSGSMTVCYTPSAAGAQAATMYIPYNACGGKDSVGIPLKGTGSFPPKVALGPVLEITPNPTNFDTALCGTTKCLTTTLKNSGNAPLTITSFGAIDLPFTLDQNTQVMPPLTLVPNETKSLQFCYSPTTAHRLDTLTVPYIADNRVSLSIEMVFDVSGSMTTPTATAGVTRIIAANSGGKVFIDNLINDPARNIIDEASVIKFSDAITLGPDFTSNTGLLNAGVPSTAVGGTRLYDALDSAVSHIKTRNQPGRRVIVLLSDGDDNSGYQQSRIDQIVAASANDVRIYTIGIGNGLSVGGIKTLTDIANLTGGNAHFTNDPDTLVQIYRDIAVSLSKNIPGDIHLAGRSVAPTLVLSVPNLAFDSVKVGDSRCADITLSNNGDAPLHLDAPPSTGNGFSFSDAGPIDLGVNQTRTEQICFSPTRLRILDTDFAFQSTSCDLPVHLPVTGIGYDSVVISLDGTFVGKPNDDVSIPIRLIGKIPLEYLVDSLRVTLSHNKTLLFPVTPVSVTNNTATAPFLMGNLQNHFVDAEEIGSNTYILSGSAMNSPLDDTLLAQLHFTALLGDSISTQLTITSAQFADGNPKVGIISNGLFRIDSLCYLNKRLIDASKRINGAFDIRIQPRVFGDPSLGWNVDYTLPGAAPTTLVVYNSAGKVVLEEWPDIQDGGPQHQTFSSLDLPSGVYFLRIQSGGTSDVVAFVVHH